MKNPKGLIIYEEREDENCPYECKFLMINCIEGMHESAVDLLRKKSIKNLRAFIVGGEFEYEPVEVVTEYKPVKL